MEIIMQLSQKETELLKDLKEQEQLCVDKYEKCAAEACDPQLKNVFEYIEGVERGHLETIKKIENGEEASLGSSSAMQKPTVSEYYSIADSEEKKHDDFLCADMLATEKHASHLYDTCVFEFKNEGLRNTLNHIQKEEQEHGKLIYDYMAANNMYS